MKKQRINGTYTADELRGMADKMDNPELLLVDPITCFKCRKKVEREAAHYWYHGDQDDLLCTDCAEGETHTDTCYAGLKVIAE